MPVARRTIEVVEPWRFGAATRCRRAHEIPVLKGTEFRVIKPYEFDKDGYRFLHGVALAWHKGRLYASFGHNKGGENTDTEEARVCTSDDGGKTWSGSPRSMRATSRASVSATACSFRTRAGCGPFTAPTPARCRTSTRGAYLLDETSGKWERKGTVVEGGFWPLGEPQRMDDGNWIMSGIRVGARQPRRRRDQSWR